MKPSNRIREIRGSDRDYIHVPYEGRHDAKAAGAQWDAEAKLWFVPEGKPVAAFARWRIDLDARNAGARFAAECQAYGLKVDDPIADGKLHRVPVDGDKGTSRSGAYILHTDGLPAGFIQNFKTAVKATWRADAPSDLSPAFEAHLKAVASRRADARALAVEAAQDAAAVAAGAVWADARVHASHSYMMRKGVAPHGLRDSDGRLLIPMRDIDGKLWSLQRIRPNGEKRFFPDGRITGCFHVIGQVDPDKPVAIAEGYATAASTHVLSGLPVLVAFNAGNLSHVARAWRSRHPDQAMLIAGDDDRHLEAEFDAHGRPKVNIGRVKAEEAARAVGGVAVFPKFADYSTRPSDWNDLMRAEGLEEARRQFQLARIIAERQSMAEGKLVGFGQKKGIVG